MRTNSVLVMEPAKSWPRLQAASQEWFFEDLDQLLKEQHRKFLEQLMLYERQCFLNVPRYQRSEQRVDQANGFYARHLTTRLGVLELRVPRSRGGGFQSQLIPRYQRREKAVNEAIRQVFLWAFRLARLERRWRPCWTKRSVPARSARWPKCWTPWSSSGIAER